MDDLVFLKRLAYKGKYKIKDQGEKTIYKVKGQPYTGMPVFRVSPVERIGKVENTHCNPHLYVCIFIQSHNTPGVVGTPLNVFNSVSLGKYQPGGDHSLSRQRQVLSSHLAQGCYIVSKLAALRLKLMMCTLRVPCAIHSATTSPQK